MTCRICGSRKIVKNGFFKIKLGKPVRRLRCKDCGKSSRSSTTSYKRENRGRRRKDSKIGSRFTPIVIDLIAYYSYRRKVSFYKAATFLIGKSRPTVRRYLTTKTTKVNQEFVISLFVKIKFLLEQENDGRMTLSIYKRLQTIANQIIETSLGPPLAYLRKDTIIWNTKSSNYRGMIEELSKK
jgi:hypothetical protein